MYTQHNCLIHHHHSVALTILWLCSTSNQQRQLNYQSKLLSSTIFSILHVRSNFDYYYYFLLLENAVCNRAPMYRIPNSKRFCVYKPINYLSTNPKCILNLCYSLPFSSIFSDRKEFRYSKDIPISDRRPNNEKNFVYRFFKIIDHQTVHSFHFSTISS